MRLACLLTLLLASVTLSATDASPARTVVTDEELLDRIHGGWLGQGIGVAFGGPTEFRLPWPPPEIVYYDPVPEACADQDDIYVELVTLLALERHGPAFSARHIGALWPRYLREEIIWVANRAAFENIRNGILPPDSGHPRYNASYKEIDAQIEADVFGLVCPGLVTTAARTGFEGALVTNWGDGAYGAAFVAACYGAALYAESVEGIVREALGTIPAQSEYAGMVRGILKLREDGASWREAREWLAEHYLGRNSPVSAIINSGAVVIGLLWGEGDFAQTLRISCMCGWDSDCNPSTAGGIVGCWLGASRIPAEWKEPLGDRYLNHWAIPKLERETTFHQLAVRTKAVAERFLVVHGATRISASDDSCGWCIPREAPAPVPLQMATDEQVSRWQREALLARVQRAVDRVAPGWRVSDCGPDMDPGLRSEYEGRRNVLVLHPLGPETSCKLTRTVRASGSGPATLRLVVTSWNGDSERAAESDWLLRVTAGGAVLCEQTIGRADGRVSWHEVTVDLSPALGKGQSADVVIENVPDDWAWEAAYLASVELTGVQQ